MATAPKIINSLISGLNPRQREVLEGRFGLDKSGGTRTLAAIGDKFGLTRERVRQIEETGITALKKALEKNGAAIRLIKKIKKEIESSGGAAKEDLLIEISPIRAEQFKRNHLIFLGEISGAFRFYPEDNDFWAFYYIDKQALEELRGFISGLAGYLEKHKAEVLAGKFDECLKGYAKLSGVEKKASDAFLGLSKIIQANRYGDKGLARWSEVAPMTSRDRAHLVLFKNKKPMHFAEIAKAINEARLGPKISLAATVHNELIKDPRFVLVGRGIYALREHGYEPGVAREVIHRILKKHGPLTPQEIIERVNKERVFQPNTIAVNLHSKSHFERLTDGRYRVRES